MMENEIEGIRIIIECLAARLDITPAELAKLIRLGILNTIDHNPNEGLLYTQVFYIMLEVR